MKTLTVRTLTLLCLLPAFAQTPGPDISGEWLVEIKVLNDTQYRRLTLKLEGDRVTGSSGNQKGEGTFRDGKLEVQFSPGPNVSGMFRGGELSGDTQMFGEAAKWRAARMKVRPADAPRTHTFEPKEFHRVFSGAIPPVLRIFPGDTVKTWSVDAGGFDAAGKHRSLGGNPQTGPFYIEGAVPGDTLVIKFNRIRLNRDTAISSGVIAGRALTPGYIFNLKRVEKYNSDWKLDREKLVGRLAEPTEKLKDYTVPLRPMLGCVAVAPPGDMSFRTGFPGVFGGNMDYNQIREGATLYLPVFKPGALLFMGDGHAAEGDGELTGNALETSMDIEFTVDLIRDWSSNGPRAENDDYIMAMGIAGSLDESFQIATTEMARWLERDYGLNSSEVASVLGTAMRYDIAEVVDPLLNVVAKISKQSLAGLKRVQP